MKKQGDNDMNELEMDVETAHVFSEDGKDRALAIRLSRDGHDTGVLYSYFNLRQDAFLNPYWVRCGSDIMGSIVLRMKYDEFTWV